MTFSIKGIHHIELTVCNLQKSEQFYSKLPGFKKVAEYPNFIMFFNDQIYLGITDHKNKQTSQIFKETNIGMDHVCFEVDSEDDLDKALIFFDQEKISHGEIKKLSNGLLVLAFRDPDNIQLELAFHT